MTVICYPRSWPVTISHEYFYFDGAESNYQSIDKHLIDGVFFAHPLALY